MLLQSNYNIHERDLHFAMAGFADMVHSYGTEAVIEHLVEFYPDTLEAIEVYLEYMAI